MYFYCTGLNKTILYKTIFYFSSLTKGMYRHRNTFVLNIEFLQTKFYDITWFLAFPNHQVHQLDPNIKITKTKINN